MPHQIRTRMRQTGQDPLDFHRRRDRVAQIGKLDHHCLGVVVQQPLPPMPLCRSVRPLNNRVVVMANLLAIEIQS